MNKDGSCDTRGFLSFLMLFMLSKKAMCGQEIAREIEKRKGCKPSPGTIYPALKQLKDNEWIKETKEGKNIMYVVTPSGKKAFDSAKKQFCKTFSDIF